MGFIGAKSQRIPGTQLVAGVKGHESNHLCNASCTVSTGPARYSRDGMGCVNPPVGLDWV